MRIAGGALVVFLLSSIAGAETRHVQPGQSIQTAANAAVAGDTIVVHAGSYAGFQVTKRGTNAAPITFQADGVVTIDGTKTTARDAIWIEDASYIVIDGFTVTSAQRAGIAALACDHITIKNNKTDKNGRWGIFSGFCDDLVVEHNEASRSVAEHGIYASNSADRPIIRGNTVWGNAMAGIHMNGDISLGGDGMISDAIVEGNTVRDNGRLGGSAINCDGVTRATIRNNMIDGNHASGISLYAIDGAGPSTGNTIVNNTIRMASDARWAINIQDASSGNTIRNNVLLNANPGRGAISICDACMASMTADHNALVGRFELGDSVVDLAAWRTRTGDSTSFAATDELFASAGDGDFSLRAGSPAIDAGASSGAPDVDITGRARPQGAGIDIGAYEHCDGTCAPTSPEDPEDPATMPSDDSGGCNSGRGAPLSFALLLLGLGLRRQRVVALLRTR